MNIWTSDLKISALKYIYEVVVLTSGRSTEKWS